MTRHATPCWRSFHDSPIPPLGASEWDLSKPASGTRDGDATRAAATGAGEVHCKFIYKLPRKTEERSRVRPAHVSRSANCEELFPRGKVTWPRVRLSDWSRRRVPTWQSAGRATSKISICILRNYLWYFHTEDSILQHDCIYCDLYISIPAFKRLRNPSSTFLSRSRNLSFSFYGHWYFNY